MVKFPNGSAMNHIEEKVLEFVALLYPEVFSTLETFSETHGNYLDHTISLFDREIQFYVSYLDYVSVFKGAELSFCYPKISDRDKEVYDYNGFDLAFGVKRILEKSPLVCNDFHLKDKERIIVVSGPNQGGKTTFARAFGQLHYLASIGCPVSGTEARLFLFDRLFTHFEKERRQESPRQIGR